MSWRDRAACNDADPEAFFPPDSYGPKPKGWDAEARRLCGACPVKAECLAAAIDEDDRHAIRGGLSIEERVALGLMGRPAPSRGCGSVAGYRAHQRAREQACRPCKDAKTRYERERKAAAA